MNTKAALFAAAAPVISKETAEQTHGRAARLAYIRMFNNVADVHVTRFVTPEGYNLDGYAFHATTAVARGVARAGFDVFATSVDHYVAVRRVIPAIAG